MCSDMMFEDRGYIKLWRKLDESDLFRRHTGAFMVFCHILMNAVYKEHKMYLGGQSVTLPPGTYITSIKRIGSHLNLTDMKVRHAVKYLVATEIVTKKTTNKYTIFYVQNWAKYQSNEENVTSKVTNEQQTNNKRVTTNKERKKERSNNKKSKKEKGDVFTATQYETFDNFFEVIWKMYPIEKRRGKKLSKGYVMKSVTTIEDIRNIKIAIENHKRQLYEMGTEAKYIPNASTFFNNWEECVDLYKEDKKPVLKYSEEQMEKMFAESLAKVRT